MNTKNIENYLNSVGKKVVNQSKGNLQRAGKGGKLEDSIYLKLFLKEMDLFCNFICLYMVST